MSATKTPQGLVPTFDAYCFVGGEVEPLGSHWTQQAALEALGHMGGGAVVTNRTVLVWHHATPKEAARAILEALQPRGLVLRAASIEAPELEPPAGAFVPSEEQRTIFDAVLNGAEHDVIVARAGTGKTTTMVEVAKLLPPGAKVLALAYNKEIERDIAKKMPSHVQVKTSHGFGYRILKTYWGARLGVDNSGAREKSAAKAALPQCLHPRDVEAVLELAARAKAWLYESDDELLTLARELGTEIEWTEYPYPDTDKPLYGDADLFRWVRALLARAVEEDTTVGYDDMLYVPAKLGMRHRPLFDFVIVDEAQDLNRSQVVLAKNALAKGGRMIVVGDPRQSIYSWRGADPEAMPRLIADLGATPRGVRELSLTVTRRCPRSVVALARELVPDLKALDDAKDGKVERVQAERMVFQWKGGDFVISRLNAPLMTYCLKALRQGTRARIQGKKLGEELARKVKKARTLEIKAFLAWLDEDTRKEHERLRRAESSDAAIEAVTDRAAVLRALAEESDDTAEMIERIEQLFDDSGASDQVVFTSAHRAKGLEADRVWLLRDTFLRMRRDKNGALQEPSLEEQNLYYVALTRSKRELYLVGGAT